MTTQRASTRRFFFQMIFASALLGLCGISNASNTPGAGTLRWQAADGKTFAAASLNLDARFEINGMIAEVKVTQSFINQSNDWLEGQYILPLPDGAAVHDMTLRIGDRVIVGEIRERAQAQAEYAAAASAGKKTSLIEHFDGNLFRTAVANVAPGESVQVEIKYWQRVAFVDGRFELVFPLNFVQRYSQGSTNTAAPTVLSNIALGDSSLSEPQISLTADLNPGMPITQPQSPSHLIAISEKQGRYRMVLGENDKRADRDFVLRWSPVAGNEPSTALFVQKRGADYFAMLMLVAPEQNIEVLPRELILVVDTSGSMMGSAMAQAIAATDLALSRLSINDRFNVIQFNSITEPLFKEPIPATSQNVQIAREWVQALQANGGTEMLPALDAALAGSAPSGFLRQVVFITDGAVSQADDLFQLIEWRIGKSRLFPVGIGDAPNAQFLTRAAKMGRGASVVIRDLNEVQARMAEMFGKLDRPALRDLSVNWPQSADTYPRSAPDLYQGEPLIVVAKLSNTHFNGLLNATGTTGKGPWAKSLKLSEHGNADGIARLWAKARIEDFDEQLYRGGDESIIRPQYIDVALANHLVTRYTSLVAVDKSPSRPKDAALVGAQTANDGLALAKGSTASVLSFLLGLIGISVLMLRQFLSLRCLARVRI